VLFELALLARLILGAGWLVKEVIDVLIIDLHVRHPHSPVHTGLLGIGGKGLKESREGSRQDSSTLVLAALNGEGLARVCWTVGKYEACIYPSVSTLASLSIAPHFYFLQQQQQQR